MEIFGCFTYYNCCQNCSAQWIGKISIYLTNFLKETITIWVDLNITSTINTQYTFIE